MSEIYVCILRNISMSEIYPSQKSMGAFNYTVTFSLNGEGEGPNVCKQEEGVVKIRTFEYKFF